MQRIKTDRTQVHKIAQRCLGAFWRAEEGAMIVFGIMLFGMMLAIGGLSFDLMRYEAHRERLQSTLDRAVLAAASLTQTNDSKAVVIDYLTKAGMADFIEPSDIIVTNGLNSRRVQATARINVPLHHGDFAVYAKSSGGTTVLVAEAVSTAEESIGNVEISMVLDVSGSMNSYGRLGYLKSAAKDFLDTIYDSTDTGAVSTSIIPYAYQVSADPDLLTFMPRLDPHAQSSCINFAASDYSHTGLVTGTSYQQEFYYDQSTNWNSSYGLGDTMPSPRTDYCRLESHRQIMAWNHNKDQLKTYVDALTATGNTSTEIGAKWGALLLDPTMQTTLNAMVTSGDVTSDFNGRPFNYDDANSLKVLVLMTDGVHTTQYKIDEDYEDTPSFVWKYTDGNMVYYSLWHDGNGSTPNTSLGPWVSNDSVCTSFNSAGGYCSGYSTYSGYDRRWFVASRNKTSSSYQDTYQWKERPHGIDSGAVRLTWAELWREIPIRYFAWETVWMMDTLSSSEISDLYDPIVSLNGSSKDTRFDNICAAVKDEDVIVFTIGLEVPSSYDARLRSCATTPGHYFDVTNLDIGSAFQTIAAQINQLRLTQ